jgi:hypothetical protein
MGYHLQAPIEQAVAASTLAGVTIPIAASLESSMSVGSQHKHGAGAPEKNEKLLQVVSPDR